MAVKDLEKRVVDLERRLAALEGRMVNVENLPAKTWNGYQCGYTCQTCYSWVPAGTVHAC